MTLQEKKISPIMSPESSLSETQMENISEGQWLVSGMSEGEIRVPLQLNGGKFIICKSFGRARKITWLTREIHALFFRMLVSISEINIVFIAVGFGVRPSATGSEPDDTLYEADDLDQVS